MRINDTTPIVYYCPQGRVGDGHCQDGMVGVVNPPDATALENYAKAASSVTLARYPDGGPFGGTFTTNGQVMTSSIDSVAPTATATASNPTVPYPTTVSTSEAGAMVKASLDAAVVAVVMAMLAA